MNQHYRFKTSQSAEPLSRFRDQMADFARAERLRELRAQRHESRERVAAEVGVSTKTVYAWENGGKIKWENAQRVGAYYGVDPEDLVSRDSEETPDLLPSFGQNEQLDRIERKLDDLAAIVSRLAVEPPRELERRLEAEAPSHAEPQPDRSRTG